MTELLWERGYAATSPRDVMTRAGVGQGSMYHHFSGKHGLAVEAMSAVTREMTSGPSLLEGEGSPLERMKRYLSMPRPGTLGCRVGRMTQDPEVVADAELIAIVAHAFDTMLARWERTIAEAIDVRRAACEHRPCRARPNIGRRDSGWLRSCARAKGEQGPMDAAVRGAMSLLDAARLDVDH